MDHSFFSSSSSLSLFTPQKAQPPSSMANTITNLLYLQPPHSSPSKPTPSLHYPYFPPLLLYTRSNSLKTIRTHFATNSAAASSGSGSSSTTTTTATNKRKLNDERVRKVHSAEEFDEALRSAKDKLVVVEYAGTHSYHSRKIYPFMVELSRTCGDVVFLLVVGDESEATRELCRREKIDKVPHFSFYKGNEKVHEEEGIGPDELAGDVLYYGGDAGSAVAQLHGVGDVERLIEEHRNDGKLIVLDVGLKHCGPCVKVYPTVVKLSRQMAETVVFARMNGDENESTMKFLKEMEVVEVPTFLFIRNGEVCGRYVGSGKGELVGEILRYQGVRVTY